MDNIIGIDYSINSGAFCSLYDSSASFGSLYRSADSLEKLKKKKDKSIIELFSVNNLQFDVIEKIQPSGEYYEVERQKLDSFIERTDLFFEMIHPHLTKETIIFMEGISFGSPGNSLLDIWGSTILLRKRLVSIIPTKNLYVFSPSSIKKFAGKGNFKKNELYEAILKISDSRLTNILEILEKNKPNWIKNSGDVAPPWNDLIDSIWIALFGENFLKKQKKD